MAEPIAGQIIRKVKQAAELYHWLLLVVAPAGAGKTTALHEVRDRTGAPLVNLNVSIGGTSVRGNREKVITMLLKTGLTVPRKADCCGKAG